MMPIDVLLLGGTAVLFVLMLTRKRLTCPKCGCVSADEHEDGSGWAMQACANDDCDYAAWVRDESVPAKVPQVSE